MLAHINLLPIMFNTKGQGHGTSKGVVDANWMWVLPITSNDE
jgi:hypothetical protein